MISSILLYDEVYNVWFIILDEEHFNGEFEINIEPISDSEDDSGMSEHM